jgi:uncharacterized protein (DUF433 family)
MSTRVRNEVNRVLDIVSEAVYEEARKLHGTPELQGMRVSVQGIAPEGLDLETMTDAMLEDLEAIIVRVFVHSGSRFVGWEDTIVFGMAERYIVSHSREYARSAFSDAIRLAPHAPLQ